MGLPVKLSENLVAAARSEAKATNRSITAQVEHWARLGCAVEAALSHDDMLALKLGGGDVAGAFNAAKKEEILELLEEVASSADRSAVKELIAAGAQPVYTTDPNLPGMLVRIEPDGSRIIGKLEGRTFVPLNTSNSQLANHDRSAD